LWIESTIRLIETAFDEDVGSGDISSKLLDEPHAETVARVVPRAAGVICGLALAPEICRVFSERLGEKAAWAAGEKADGSRVQAGESVATLRGARAALLTLERTLLNFLGRMSGVATLTRRFVDAAQRANPNVRILDTRKTIPGWRELDKCAVHCGGGENHRLGLYDAVLIKDNHLAGIPTERLSATLFEMLNRRADSAALVEVEVEGLEQLAEVCKVVGIDVVLLDNFSPEQVRAAVANRDEQGLRGKMALEASGRITLENVAKIAATGVERISIGALTHSAASLDIGLDR
jgi:nicotinate-nucleotide pyrophosphorylase (carboxylating)